MRGLRLLLVAIAAFAMMPLFAAGSGAQEVQQYPPTNTVIPTRTVKPSEPKGKPPTVLPFTGAELVTFGLIGFGAIGSGLVIVGRSRRRK